MLQLLNYKDIDPEISNAAAKELANHLWYLGPETATLSLIDENVPSAVKANMAIVLLETDNGEEEDEEEPNVLKRFILQQNDFLHLKT